MAEPPTTPQTMTFNSDMSPDDTFQIMKQEDGDFILTITSGGISGIKRSASVEFCTPMTGGGKYPDLWRALAALWARHEKDLPENCECSTWTDRRDGYVCVKCGKEWEYGENI